MNAKEMAALLDERERTQEMTLEEQRKASDSGLVVIMGASDDLVEFSGAIHDEISAIGGAEFYMNASGLVQNECPEGDDCPYFKERLEKAKKFKAIFGDPERGAAWNFDTEVPHEKFTIVEGDEKFCVGIVVRMEDLA